MSHPNIIHAAAAEVGKWAPIRILDLEDQIKEAINVLMEKNQSLDEPKAIVVSVPVAVKINLDESTVEISAAVSVKYKASNKVKLEDPNQPELLDRDGDPLPESVAKPFRQIRSAVSIDGVNVNKIGNKGGAK